MISNDLIRSLQDITVLYVEDDKNTQEEVVFFLKKKVKKLFVANDGKEGFDQYLKNKPDLVITDINMPNLNGIEMSKLIINENENANILIITAYNDTHFLFEAITLKISHYLTKPLDLYLLLEIMASMAKDIKLENHNSKIFNTLKQYKDVVDDRSIVAKTDLNGKITYVNEPFEKISGYTNGELLGKSHNIIKHPDTNVKVYDMLWKRIKIEKKSWQGRIKNIAKDGTEYYIDTIIKPILDINGEIEEFIALSNDITDLEKTKEYLLKETHTQVTNFNDSLRTLDEYKSAINESNIILRVDLDENITYANEAFCKISKYTKEELLGQKYTMVKHPKCDEEEYSNMFESIHAGNIWKGNLSNLAKDGSTFHCRVTVFPLKDKYGKIKEFMGIRHDITEIINLHSELEDTQRELIYKMGEVGEKRSQETGFHVKRVAHYSRFIATKYGLDTTEANVLFMASPMHDIGKVGIPDSILNKPGKLDSKEWDIMKNHTEIGFNILNSSTRPVLKAAAIVSYAHHERWDGTGYPCGVKGEDIHIFGRITAIADVFDALGSDRVYKKAWELEKILLFLNEEKGKQFDPHLVDIFMENLDTILEIRENFKDCNEEYK